MSRAAAAAWVCAGLAGALASGCLGGSACTSDSSCAEGSTCIEGGCAPMPEGCRRGAGDFGDAQRIALAAVLPLSGEPAEGDAAERARLNALEQAIDEMNGHRVNGRPFALYVCDCSHSGTRTAAQSSWLAHTARVPAIVTSGTAQTLVASLSTRDQGTLVMSATATSPALADAFHDSGGLLWRTVPPETLQARVLVDRLLTDATYASAQKLGVLYSDDAQGASLQTELAQRLTQAGRAVVSARFPPGGDVLAAVDALATAAVGGTVVVAPPADTSRLLAAAFQRGPLRRSAGHRWAFTGTSRPAAVWPVPDAASELQGAVGTALAQGAGAPFPLFREAYQVRFGADPIAMPFTAHSYDAMYVLGLAASYATAQGRTLSGRTLAEAMELLSSRTRHPLEPRSFPVMRDVVAAGLAVDVDGNSGHLDFVADAGAPNSAVEVWRAEADGGVTSAGTVEPP